MLTALSYISLMLHEKCFAQEDSIEACDDQFSDLTMVSQT